MWEVAKNFRINFGGNTFINTPTIIGYKGESLFDVRRRESDGQLGISLDICDKKGARIAVIRNNRVVEGDETNYAFVRDMYRYAIREKSSDRFVLDIRRGELSPDAELSVTIKTYLPNGFLLDVTPEQANLTSPKGGGIHMVGSTLTAMIAFNIEEDGSFSVAYSKGPRPSQITST